MKNLKELFGENYRILRDRTGFTQEKVSEGSGLSLSYLSLVEQGKANPTLTSIERLAKGLEMDVTDLLDFHHSQSSPQEIRDRLTRLMQMVDNEILAGIHSAILSAFRP